MSGGMLYHSSQMNLKEPSSRPTAWATTSWAIIMSTERKQILVDFLKSKGAHFEQNRLTGFSQPPLPNRQAPTLSVLSSQGLLEITGADAERFLQGQLTSNVAALDTGHYQPSAACTPKGRMFSNFDLVHLERGYLLAMHNGLVDNMVSSLSKYAVFFKTELKANDTHVGLGLSGDGINEVIQSLFGSIPQGNAVTQVNQGWLMEVPGLCPRYEFWLPISELEDYWYKLVPRFTPTSEDHWQLLDIEAVQPKLTPEALEKYIPQHFNLASLGYISFRKGCYTGQEIVARMQNLGQLKSRTYRLTSAEFLPIEPMTKVFDGKGKSIGEIILSIIPTTGSGTEILAVIRSEAAEANDVYLQPKAKQPLEVQPTPYEINPKEELTR